MAYIDSFILAIPRASLEAYKAQAEIAGKVWKELGALEYHEWAGDDVPYGKLTSFPRAVEATDDKVIILGMAIYADRATRDATNKRVMADPRMDGVMQASGKLGADLNRMIWGGFDGLVDA